MASDSDPRLIRGRVVVALYRFTDDSTAKPRPAVILGRHALGDVYLAFVGTQRPHPDEPTIRIDAGTADWQAMGLLHGTVSYIHTTKLLLLPPEYVHSFLGTAPAPVMLRIADDLAAVLPQRRGA